MALASFLHSGAYVAGIDFRHMWNNREWFVNGTLTGSRVQGSAEAILLTQTLQARYWQRPDADHVPSIPPGPAWTDGGGPSPLVDGPGIIGWDRSSSRLRAPDSRPTTWASRPGWTPGTGSSPQYRDMEPDKLTRCYQIDFVPASNGTSMGTWWVLMSSWGASSSGPTSGCRPRPSRLTPRRTMTGSPEVGLWPVAGGIQRVSVDLHRPTEVVHGQDQFTYAMNGRGGWGFFPTSALLFGLLRPWRSAWTPATGGPTPWLSTWLR